MGPGWFLRMSRWARHPPSWRQVKLVVAVVAVCILIVVLERIFGWPEALTVNRVPRGPGF